MNHEPMNRMNLVLLLGLLALTFGDSDALRSGQLVLAFGSPLLDSSVSMGVVSAVARQLTPEDPRIQGVVVALVTADPPYSQQGPLEPGTSFTRSTALRSMVSNG